MRTVHAGSESRRTAWNQRCMPTSSMASTRVTTTGCKSCTRPAPVLHHVLHNVLLSTSRVGTICTCTAMLSRSVPPNLPHGHRGCYIADARLPSLAVCHAAAASHGHRCCVTHEHRTCTLAESGWQRTRAGAGTRTPLLTFAFRLSRCILQVCRGYFPSCCRSRDGCICRTAGRGIAANAAACAR